jgi:hypothetical protein
MVTLREWLHRLWGSVTRSRRDRELESELRTHLELAENANGSAAAAFLRPYGRLGCNRAELPRRWKRFATSAASLGSTI